ncbi:TolC family protein [Sulfurospirillum sp. hDNRA2]|uniref:TolC family protein n=1 Tax=Sulfurospirillum sp. hDNRA2 TaxID=3237298 RepID=UPI0020B7DCEB|nr:TolC family protein [Sulfurospirillum sp. DNRA8]MCP3651021.1 TolC family protein [Sulfurospirillum sp. DNRA8]MCR1809867.1 TolC family protein [Sulfurospirillum sp. DNRA8]
MIKKGLISLLWFCVSLAHANDESLHLYQAYELALSYAPKYKAQSYKTDATAEGIEQAKSKLYPKIDLTGSGGKYEYETYYNGESTSEMYKTYSLSLVQPLYRPEILDVIEQSKTRYDASREELSQQEQQLGIDVAKAYFKVLQISMEMEKLDTQKIFYESKYQKILSMLPLGFSNTIEMLDVKANKDKALVDYVAKKREFQAEKAKLERLIGQSVHQVLPYEGNYDIQKFSKAKSLWKKRLQENNKDSKIAELSKEAARMEMDIRKYEHYPKVDLVVSKAQNYTNDLVAHKYDNKAMVQISVPLYQGGYTKSRVQEATLLFHAASENFNAVNTQILDQFEDIWTQRESLLESIGILEEAKHSAQMYLLAIRQGEKEGTKSQVDILEAETKFQSMKSELAITFYEMLLNELNLLALTGDLSLTKMQQIETMFFNN